MKNKGLFGKIANILGYLVVALLIVAVVFTIVQKANKKTVFVFNRTVLWVLTQSMEPEIPKESYILVKKATADDVKIGDVIVFKSDDKDLNGALNTHRVIRIAENNAGFVTKGDNNLSEDELPARYENVVGIYIKGLPILTLIGRAFMSPLGFVLINVCIIGVLALIYLPDLIRRIKRINEEEKSRAAAEKEAQTEALVREEVERLKREGLNAKNTDGQDKFE